ncbi:protein FAM161A isoform X1 [Psammomys obesus]|uniref:protein FAM161A isoform X1 n=1 Tax=Psammomys obesus TaxID=48139 RepID=UPI002452BC00|nr:protein FAM161A isoform X1 [Psammomys obesus]
MASPHLAAKLAARLAAASLHLPVNAPAGARGAQCEREDPLASVLAATLEEERSKGLRSARASASYTSFPREDRSVAFDSSLNFSDISHSDEEYYRKLKELKAVHEESMAKLEKMCQEQLTLRDLHPVMAREDSSSVSSSFASEKNSPIPVMVVTSFSEPDLGLSPSLSTASEEELPSPEKDSPRESRTMAYAKELINNMWKGFSLEDYIQYDSDFGTAKKARRKPKSWVPKVTVPVPFQMTVRDQEKREEALKARSDLEMRQKLLKSDEDEAECKKKFRAHPVPSYVLLPLYEDLVRQSEERRRTAKEKSKAALLASQKPFKFIEREEQKQAIREKLLRDLFKSKRKTKGFKARPVPHFIYRPAANGKSKDGEFYRDMRRQLKSRELQQNPSWPYLPAYRQPRNPRSHGRPRLRHRFLSPDDGDFAEEQKEPFSAQSVPKCSTPGKQCGLRDFARHISKRQKVFADIRADEENLKETCGPYLSSRSKSPVRSAWAKPRPSQRSPPMPTVSSRGREQAIRKSLEEKKMLEEERNRILSKQKQRTKELQKLLATRVKAYDSHHSLAQMLESRVNNLRKSGKARMKEYRQELEEQDKKLQNRPMLFERVAQRNARMAAEKHYSNTLKALGLSEEFVSEKGQSGRVSGNVSRRELRSCTSDKESSCEEESENKEENDFIDTNSQDSCQENKEGVEESRGRGSEE